MKKIPALSFIAALAAFILLPVSFAIAGTALFAAALLSIICSDYSRPVAATQFAVVHACRRERFGLAA